MGEPMISLIIPVYKNELNIPHLLTALTDLEKTRLSGQLQTVFVVDGSPDRSYEILRDQLPKLGWPCQLVLLSRNFGSFSAIRAGLEHVQSDYYAVMAADLQEPPELVAQMYDAMTDGSCDVVVATRESRRDPFLTRLPATLFWSFYKKFVVRDMPTGGIDVFGCTRIFRDQLLRMRESHSSLIAQIFWLGFRRKFVPYERRERQHGVSAWTFRKKLVYLADSVFAFTDLPIRLLVRLGGGGALIFGLVGLVAFFGRILGFITVPGYAATMVAIAFFGAINLLGLGIVGSYAWRAYENTKDRPLSVVVLSHSNRST